MSGTSNGVGDDISAKAGARFFMAGQCLVDGLRALGVEHLAAHRIGT